MNHSSIIALGALALFAGPAAAQTAPAAPPPISAAQVQALIGKAEAMAKAKPDQTTFVQPLLKIAPYTENLEYRTGAGVSAIHEADDELFYVIDGSGVLQTGGEMAKAKRSDPHNIVGAALQGATARPVSKGDFFVVPQGTPHWFSAVHGKLVMMSLHVPGQAAAGH